jgi:hypothetical protein
MAQGPPLHFHQEMWTKMVLRLTSIPNSKIEAVEYNYIHINIIFKTIVWNISRAGCERGPMNEWSIYTWYAQYAHEYDEMLTPNICQKKRFWGGGGWKDSLPALKIAFCCYNLEKMNVHVRSIPATACPVQIDKA